MRSAASGSCATDGDPSVCQNLDYVTAFGKRIKDEGMAFMLDFHYSDTWADPAHQTVPKAWEGLNATQLTTQVYDYTKAALEALVAAGATPDYIQVGNEVTCGMLWDYGRINSGGKNNIASFVNFLKAGVRACREVCPDAKVVIHMEHLQNASYITQNFSTLVSRGVDYDIIGLSYYPFWHGDIAALRAALRLLRDMALQRRGAGELPRRPHRRAEAAQERHRTLLVVPRGERHRSQRGQERDVDVAQPRTLEQQQPSRTTRAPRPESVSEQGRRCRGGTTRGNACRLRMALAAGLPHRGRTYDARHLCA